jgi:hypothetical protein
MAGKYGVQDWPPMQISVGEDMKGSTGGRQVPLCELEFGSKIPNRSNPEEKAWCLMMRWTMLEWRGHGLNHPCLLLKMVEGEVVVMELEHREVEEMQS